MMGGRDIPVECPHGRIISWGDFGEPDEAEDCPECGIVQESPRGSV